MNIQVTNLSLNIIDRDLRKLFAAYGEVISAVVLRDQRNGRSRGAALIDMINHVQGEKAVAALDHTLLDGKKISVSEIKYSPSL